MGACTSKTPLEDAKSTCAKNSAILPKAGCSAARYPGKRMSSGRPSLVGPEKDLSTVLVYCGLRKPAKQQRATCDGPDFVRDPRALSHHTALAALHTAAHKTES